MIWPELLNYISNRSSQINESHLHEITELFSLLFSSHLSRRSVLPGRLVATLNEFRVSSAHAFGFCRALVGSALDSAARRLA